MSIRTDRLTRMGISRTVAILCGVAIAATALTGCTGDPTAAPSTTQSAPDNTAACEAFWDVTVDMATAFTDTSADVRVATEGMEARFDDAYLEASGEVAARIKTTMDNFPEQGLYMLAIGGEKFMEDMQDVVRACRADGVPLEDAPRD